MILVELNGGVGVVALVAQSDSDKDAVEAARQDAFEQVLYHITHDLRATLRALKTVPEWIREDLAADGRQLSKDTDENLSMLEVQAARADQMLMDLRTYARVGRMHDPVCLVCLDATITRITSRGAIPRKFRLTSDLQAPAIMGPANEIDLLLGALVSNAIKHHDRAPGNIHVASTGLNEQIIISVEDDGPGIAPEFRERVFDMMTTLRARDHCEGSGLGLSIARKIAEHHGGTIRITDPTQERGCRVEIRWPSTHDSDHAH